MEYWTVPKIWQDGIVWIIGGGASMPRQFNVPEDIIKQVESGESPLSLYSDYLHPLHDKHIVAINAAFMLGDWVSAMYFCDRTFLKHHYRSLNQFPNLKITCVNSVGAEMKGKAIGLKRLKRDNRPGISLQSDTICWNKNSGAAAINFAILAGAKQINLLGFDMKAQQGRTHWHQGIKTYEKPTSPLSFKRFLPTFPTIAIQAKKLGVSIYNISEDSAITCFEKKKLNEVL